MPPIIDIHIHINPHGMVNPPALELIKRGRRDYDDAEKYAANPAEFLKFMDSADIERAGLINYVSPRRNRLHRRSERLDRQILLSRSQKAARIWLRAPEIYRRRCRRS